MKYSCYDILYLSVDTKETIYELQIFNMLYYCDYNISNIGDLNFPCNICSSYGSLCTTYSVSSRVEDIETSFTLHKTKISYLCLFP